MTPRWLYWPSLLVAALGGAVVVVAVIFEPPQEMIVRPLAILAAAIVTLLFLRMLFDPACHRGIEAANREMMGGQGFQFRLMPILDPQWGLFGSRGGTPLLLAVRGILFIEAIVTMFLVREAPTLTLLAFASFGVVMMLSLLHAAEDSHPVSD